MLNQAIQSAKELPKDVREIPEKTLKTFNVNLARVYKNRDVRENTPQASKDAIKQLSNAGTNRGKEFTLDQMTEMVNKQAKKNEPQRQPGV